MNKYKEYAKHMNCNDDVMQWMENHLSSYLKENEENQTEIEHILDYMASDKRPKRISKMSYDHAKSNTEKWNAALIKKGMHINETDSDIEVIKDFKDGFKIVKLIGENAYKREGFLMRHCVASYYGNGDIIYSLRDSDNIPHCTMEEGEQIKGKGNGSINPKYVGYIVHFLNEIGMHVGDNEMKNLGYINVEKIKHKLHKDTDFFNGVYIHESYDFKNIDGEEYCELDIWDYKPLINSGVDLSLSINFDLKVFLPKAFNLFKNASNNARNAGDYAQNASSGNNAQNASSGDYAQNASSGNNAQNASSGDYAQNASSGNYAQNASSGNNAQNASSGDYAQNASSGNNAQNASSGDYAQNASSGDYAQNASSGDYAQNASSGNNAQNASSGDYAQNASSGDYAQNASSGDYAQNASSGNNAQNASSGDYAQNASSGDYAQKRKLW
jgi:hypothetical protein